VGAILLWVWVFRVPTEITKSNPGRPAEKRAKPLHDPAPPMHAHVAGPGWRWWVVALACLLQLPLATSAGAGCWPAAAAGYQLHASVTVAAPGAAAVVCGRRQGNDATSKARKTATGGRSRSGKAT
jgi:hypothetical protein